MIVWALPRLARRVGADPDRALWWGAANPLVLFHVVGGAHNDGLMVGLMMAGLEIGLAGVAARRRPGGRPRPTSPRSGDAELAHAEPDQQRGGVVVGGQLAAHRDGDAGAAHSFHELMAS